MTCITTWRGIVAAGQASYLSVALIEGGHLPLLEARETPPELLRMHSISIAVLVCCLSHITSQLAGCSSHTSSVVVASALFSALWKWSFRL